MIVSARANARAVWCVVGTRAHPHPYPSPLRKGRAWKRRIAAGRGVMGGGLFVRVSEGGGVVLERFTHLRPDRATRGRGVSSE